jgi:thiamine biosynthesis protein ThiS
MAQHPTGFGRFLCAHDFHLGPVVEIALLWPAADGGRPLLDAVFGRYVPNRIVVGAEDGGAAAGLPLLEGRRAIDGRATAYVCRNYACELPATDAETLARQLAAARRRERGGILRSSAVGGGFLRTGCGPGPLEPDLDNPSEGNTARAGAAAPSRGAAVRVSGAGAGMTIVVNGKSMDVTDGLSVEDLLRTLQVKREYMAVAVNREVMPKARYASAHLREGDRVEIVRPMGGGSALP